MPKRDDRLLVEDIKESGAKILRYVSGYTFKDFEKDERTFDAVIRNFEIIDEASRNLSPAFLQKHNSVEWLKIVGYRNIFIHEYFGVSISTVWSTIQEDLRDLMNYLHNLENER
jgi:uncharacterized protein with HEPN domain